MDKEAKQRFKKKLGKIIKQAKGEGKQAVRDTYEHGKKGLKRTGKVASEQAESAYKRMASAGSKKVGVRKGFKARRKVKIKFKGKKPAAPQEAQGNLIGGNQFFNGEMADVKRSMFFNE